MKTLITFESSAFNTTESKDYFINPGCFGDDVAKWLIDELKSKGVEVDKEPSQEDFGWYFNFNLPEGRYCFVIGFKPESDNVKSRGTWVGWLEHKCGFISSVFGGRKRGISQKAVEIINQIMMTSQNKIENIIWHIQNDFDKTSEDFVNKKS